MNNKNNKKGISIIGILILGFILILVISYFNIRIKSVVESPAAKENIEYVGGSSKNLWTSYLKKPAEYLWNDVFIHLFWEPFYYNMNQKFVLHLL